MSTNPEHMSEPDPEADFAARWRAISAKDDAFGKEQDALVARAKAENTQKEPFDAAKLKGYFDYSNLHNLQAPGASPTAATDRDMEIRYYLRFPEVTNLREFAEKLLEIESNGGL